MRVCLHAAEPLVQSDLDLESSTPFSQLGFETRILPEGRVEDDAPPISAGFGNLSRHSFEAGNRWQRSSVDFDRSIEYGSTGRKEISERSDRQGLRKIGMEELRSESTCECQGRSTAPSGLGAYREYRPHAAGGHDDRVGFDRNPLTTMGLESHDSGSSILLVHEADSEVM